MVRAWLAIVILAALNGVVRGDEGSLSDRQRIVTDLAKRTVELTQFRVAKGNAPLVHHGPLLRWSNPTAGEVHGEIHLWTEDGRPACIGSVYRWFSPQWGATLEVSSLVDRPVVARQLDREFWKPPATAIRWEPLAGSEAPADTPAARLIQMRRILRDFAATLRDTRRTEEPVERRLRLMPQPLFRYPAPSATASYLDGAMFSFVEGTDPEVLILLECDAAKTGAAPAKETEPAWRWGAVRMNMDSQTVSLSGRAAWSADGLELSRVLSAPAEPYAYFMLEEQTGEVKR